MSIQPIVVQPVQHTQPASADTEPTRRSQRKAKPVTKFTTGQAPAKTKGRPTAVAKPKTEGPNKPKAPKGKPRKEVAEKAKQKAGPSQLPTPPGASPALSSQDFAALANGRTVGPNEQRLAGRVVKLEAEVQRMKEVAAELRKENRRLRAELEEKDMLPRGREVAGLPFKLKRKVELEEDPEDATPSPKRMRVEDPVEGSGSR
ncbi:hypothetical protein BDN72DRAFT_864541 [Pluteus cervinus]|uniref:Uncharacterized protein n=1 Tax=Pluteus cervinus TaxID=181527 RepID=A0ACD3A3D5_9AGAR|nr:hypothetical protein BDN72DRAFT_864541 [Pluteus cervinus]